MPKWTVNPDYSGERTVTADYIHDGDQFVDFMRSGGGGFGGQDLLVLRVRAEDVRIVKLDEE